MRGQDLIDNFINNEGVEKIELKDNLEFSPQLEEEEIIAVKNSTDEGLGF